MADEEELALLRSIAKWAREAGLPHAQQRIDAAVDSDAKRRVYIAMDGVLTLCSWQPCKEERLMADEMVSILRSIDRRLALLTLDRERDLWTRFERDLLRTASRTAMWNAIDGATPTSGIANAAGVSERLAQMFLKELRESGLVSETPDERLVEQDADGIVRWYRNSIERPANA